VARTLRYEAEIDAEPHLVWAALTDFHAYPEWNPFIRSLEGELQVGARLKVKFGGELNFTIRPRVVSVEPGASFRWRGSLLGLFNGEHTFRVRALPGGRSHFSQSEDFDGPLVPLAWPFLRERTLASFEAMGEGLAERVARGYAPQGADQEGPQPPV
jgi:hypothetical protein